MFIDKYKEEDGWYIDNEGIAYESPEDILGDKLGFCGCGNTQAALSYVALILQSIKDKKRISSLFQSEGQMYTMYYYLTDKGMLEHGVSVPGWLTQQGEEMLSDINELLLQQGN